MMQRFDCPGCGAPVAFRSAASVTVVCEYCRTTSLREAGAVRDIGKASAVLEDYTPVRIGASGTWNGGPFDVVGRVQLRYAAGQWNEWAVLFQDGHAGWLSDAQGHYAITRARPAPSDLPTFDHWQPGVAYAHAGTLYVASDVREAHAVGAEGELPMRVGEAWVARVVDLRAGTRFLTLDYSDPAPVLYAGEAVEWGALAMQLARSEDEIKEKAGRYRGKVDALACPSCGNAIKYLPGLTPRLVCDACAAHIDTSPERTEVLRTAERMPERSLTYALGDVATIEGKPYMLIGALTRVTDDEDAERWNEYLLHHPGAGFRWLVETSEGWQHGRVLDEWPQRVDDASMQWRGQRFAREYAYGARVVHAVGAFNWRVEVGDRAHVEDYANGEQTLTSEADAHELGWTLAHDVDGDVVAQWFGRPATGKARVAKDGDRRLSYKGIAKAASWGIAIFHLSPLLDGIGAVWMYAVIALAAVWIPALVLGGSEDA